MYFSKPRSKFRAKPATALAYLTRRTSRRYRVVLGRGCGSESQQEGCTRMLDVSCALSSVRGTNCHIHQELSRSSSTHPPPPPTEGKERNFCRLRELAP